MLQGEAARFFQLWIALPASQEHLPAKSQYVAPSDVQQDGPRPRAARRVWARVVRSGRRRASTTSTYDFSTGSDGAASLRPAGQPYRRLAGSRPGTPAPRGAHPRGPARPWTRCSRNQTSNAIETQADGNTSFVIGSRSSIRIRSSSAAIRSTTSENALAQGEAEIRRIGHQLRAHGRR